MGGEGERGGHRHDPPVSDPGPDRSDRVAHLQGRGGPGNEIADRAPRGAAEAHRPGAHHDRVHRHDALARRHAGNAAGALRLVVDPRRAQPESVDSRPAGSGSLGLSAFRGRAPVRHPPRPGGVGAGEALLMTWEFLLGQFATQFGLWWVIWPAILLGIVVGILPGFSPQNTLIMLLPLTLSV